MPCFAVVRQANPPLFIHSPHINPVLSALSHFLSPHLCHSPSQRRSHGFSRLHSGRRYSRAHHSKVREACHLAIRCTPLAERNCGPMYALRRGTCPAHWAHAPGRCTLYGAERARGKESTARLSWRVKEDPGRQREGPSWPLPSLPMASKKG